MSKNLKKILVLTTMAVFAISFLSPWLLYWIGLSNVEGKPTLANIKVSAEDRQRAWNQYACDSIQTGYQEVGPYEFLYPFLSSNRERETVLVPSVLRIAEPVAVEFDNLHRAKNTMIWHHLSATSTAVWLTRNWTIEQLLDKVIELQAQGRIKFRPNASCAG